MAMRNIVKLGDPTLKKHSRTVEKFDDRLAQLIDDMKRQCMQTTAAVLLRCRSVFSRG